MNENEILKEIAQTTCRRFKAEYAEAQQCAGVIECDLKCPHYERSKNLYTKLNGAGVLVKEGEWLYTEKGCVITCSVCGERLELCAPDGTEVRWSTHCPDCDAFVHHDRALNERPDSRSIDELYPDWKEVRTLNIFSNK